MCTEILWGLEDEIVVYAEGTKTVYTGESNIQFTAGHLYILERVFIDRISGSIRILIKDTTSTIPLVHWYKDIVTFLKNWRAL